MDYKYSNIIRDSFRYLHNIFDNINHTLIDSNDILASFICDNFLDKDENILNSQIYKNNNQYLQLITSLIHASLITDYYRFSVFKCIQDNKNVNKDKNIIDLKSAIYSKKTENIIKSKKLFTHLTDALILHDEASGLEKILLNKSLSSADVELLNEYNPLFIDEYNHYNVEVNKNLIDKHLKIWSQQFGDTKAYEAISEFICTLFKINIIEVKNLLNEMFNENELNDIITFICNEDTDSIQNIIKNYYQTNIARKK